MAQRQQNDQFEIYISSVTEKLETSNFDSR